jgi:hypothetical protein
VGEFVAGGYRPRFEEELKNHGFDFPPEMFLSSAVRERREKEQLAQQQAQQESKSRFGRQRR